MFCNWWTIIDVLLLTKIHVYIRVHSLVGEILWILTKCIMSCNHHSNTIENTFTILKFPYSPQIHPSLPPSLQIPGRQLMMFLLSYIFPFFRMFYSWNHTTIWYNYSKSLESAFSDWLLHQFAFKVPPCHVFVCVCVCAFFS